EADAVGIAEAIADLVVRHRVAELGDQPFGLSEARQVEGDEQLVARVVMGMGRHQAKLLALSMKDWQHAASMPRVRSSLRLPSSSKACAADETAQLSGITSAPQPTSSTCRTASCERMP